MLALVGLVMVGMLSFLAVVVDMSRMYTQKNELQTAADAAALAGLSQLYGDLTMVDDTAIKYGEQNKVQKQTITIDGAEVICGVWTPDTGPFTPNAGGICEITDNAVSVTARAAALSAMPSILDVGNKQLASTAIAWGAFVDATDCIKPFGLLHEIVTKLLQPGNADVNRQLDATDFYNLRTMPAAQLTFSVKWGDPATEPFGPGNFGALAMNNDPDRESDGNGGSVYRDNIAKCNTVKYERGDIIGTKPGNMVGPTEQGAEDFCQPLAANGDCMFQGQIGRPGKIVTFLMPVGSKCNGSTCEVVVMDIIGFSMDKVVIDNKAPSSAQVTGHLVPLVSGGTITSIITGIIRPILVK